MSALRCLLCAISLSTVGLLPAAAAPSVYPTGVTIYDPARTWNGYTVLSPRHRHERQRRQALERLQQLGGRAGARAAGGGVIAASGARPPFQESLELVQRDFDGKVVWSFNRSEQIELRDRGTPLIGFYANPACNESPTYRARPLPGSSARAGTLCSANSSSRRGGSIRRKTGCSVPSVRCRARGARVREGRGRRCAAWWQSRLLQHRRELREDA